MFGGLNKIGIVLEMNSKSEMIMQSNYIDVFQRYQNHVYLVGIIDGETRGLRKPLDASIGTAFAVSKEGHFLTAYHVIEDDYSDSSLKRKSSLEKIKKLSYFKQAIVLSEILGPPKGFDL